MKKLLYLLLVCTLALTACMPYSEYKELQNEDSDAISTADP